MNVRAFWCVTFWYVGNSGPARPVVSVLVYMILCKLGNVLWYTIEMRGGARWGPHNKCVAKNRGFKEVYQIDGGIIKYGQKYGDDGLWEGSLYVFDGRMGTKFSDKAIDIGSCVHCQGKTSNYENCAVKSCNNLVLICKDCKTTHDTCSPACAKLVTA